VAQARAEAFARSRGDPALALALAAALGLSVALSPDEREALRKAGLSHLIAVSGLNVAVAAMLAWTGVLRVAAWLGRSPRAAVLLSWVPVVGYVALTGAAPSAVRAAVMLALLGLGVAVGRPVHGLCSLCVAAAVILTAVPEWAVDPGFQMSLGAMGALVTAPPRAGILAQSWRVGWVVAPLSWFHFGQASPWGLLSNVVAIPLFSFWILPTALLGWSLTPWLGDIALAPAATGARIVLDLARVVARLPQPEGRAVELAAVLAVAATLGAWAGLSWLRVWARRAWLPPILASAGLLAAVRGKGPSAEDGHWYAVGGPRVASLVAPGGPGRACLRGAGLSPDRWRDLLDELGITEVGLEAAGGDPRLAELRERLASRLTELDPGACAWPDEAAARRALARCLERSGGRRGIVRGRVGAPEIECFAGGGWKPLVGSGRR
jgi:competence protein ComEC